MNELEDSLHKLSSQTSFLNFTYFGTNCPPGKLARRESHRMPNGIEGLVSSLSRRRTTSLPGIGLMGSIQ